MKEQPGGGAAGYEKDNVRDGTCWRHVARGARGLSNRCKAKVGRSEMMLAFVGRIEEANLWPRHGESCP